METIAQSERQSRTIVTFSLSDSGGHDSLQHIKLIKHFQIATLIHNKKSLFKNILYILDFFVFNTISTTNYLYIKATSNVCTVNICSKYFSDSSVR